VLTSTVDGRAVRTAAGFAITPEHGPEALDEADTVVLPPSADLIEALDADGLPEPVAGALRRIRPGMRVVSICTASYLLAAHGLLDDRPATTHWHEAARFQQRFPRVRVDPGVLFVDDGDVLTSAGAAAGVDLCLHLVRRDHGAATANAVARRCVVPPWRDGGQAQYIERPVPEPTAASTTATRVWAIERLHQRVTLTQLAGHARMSVRTFSRRFRDEVGTTPGQWLTLQRLEHARRLLEASDLSIDQVADSTGFGTASSLRKHLRATLGVSPAAYRRTFRS
jgi:transcriptional regulator GlxA family with amidase domain